MPTDTLDGQASEEQPLLPSARDDAAAEQLRAARIGSYACCSIGLLFFVLGIILMMQGWSVYKPGQHESSALVPPMPHEFVKFQEDPRFTGPSIAEHESAWFGMIPPSQGFITMDHPEKYNLPPGANDSDGKQTYMVSVFHQLFCLSEIRYHLLLLEGGDGMNMSAENPENTVGIKLPHLFQCFDYLRQAIMCAGDMTIEWPTERAGGVTAGFGWGVRHECKSWDAILDSMNKRT